MNSLHRRKQLTRRKTILGTLLVALGTVLLAGIYLYASDAVITTAHSIAGPVRSSGSGNSDLLGSAEMKTASRKELRSENARLRRMLQNARIQLAQLEVLKEQNDTFRQMWERGTTTEGVLAGVITRPPESPYDLVVLDAGRGHGVAAGDYVVRAGTVLGKVTRVYTKTAVAELYSTGGVTTEGFIAAHDLAVDLSGAGNGSFRASIPKNIIVEEGDVVTASGLAGKILAEVVSVESNANDPQQHILLQSPINISGLRYVRIMSGHEKPFTNQ